METYRYGYDKNGSQTSRELEKLEPVRAGTKTELSFTNREPIGDEVKLDLRDYDGFGRLVRVYRDGELSLYRYRPDGMRHSKALGASNASRSRDERTTHHWDGQNIVMETGQTSAVKSRYLRGTSLIAQQIDAAVQYYLFNAHGDVVQRIDVDGNATPMYDYDAFGNLRNPAVVNGVDTIIT